MTQQIETMRAQVETATELARTLGAGLEAFALLVTVCQACEEQAGELFAAFTYAGAAAAQGWLALAAAPSLAVRPGKQAGHGASVLHDLETAADALAALAHAMRDRLSAAGRSASDPGDRAACVEAAAEAARIAELLSREQP